MLQVDRDRVEAMGRWALDAVRWRLPKLILLYHQRNWDRGWLQPRAQEEAVQLRVREGDQWLRIVRWHAQGPEHRARQAAHVQVQQERIQLVGLEGPARALVGPRPLGGPQADR